MPAALPPDLTTPRGRLGAALRARREALGLTQVALADRAAVSQAMISAYESGLSQPSDAAEAALCAALGWTRGQWSDAADAFAPPAAPQRRARAKR